MIKKQIDISSDLSSDAVFQIIEMYFAGYYKTKRHTDSILKIKRLYTFQTSFGWSNNAKHLNFNDSGYFQINDNKLLFVVDLTKQIVFWSILAIFGLFICWRIYSVSLLISMLLIFIPMLFV